MKPEEASLTQKKKGDGVGAGNRYERSALTSEDASVDSVTTSTQGGDDEGQEGRTPDVQSLATPLVTGGGAGNGPASEVPRCVGCGAPLASAHKPHCPRLIGEERGLVMAADCQPGSQYVSGGGSTGCEAHDRTDCEECYLDALGGSARSEEEAAQAGEPWDGGPVDIAYCPEHGLHGCRTTCFTCGGPVEQIRMEPVERTDLSTFWPVVDVHAKRKQHHSRPQVGEGNG